jgi:hypothetical protein
MDADRSGSIELVEMAKYIQRRRIYIDERLRDKVVEPPPPKFDLWRAKDMANPALAFDSDTTSRPRSRASTFRGDAATRRRRKSRSSASRSSRPQSGSATSASHLTASYLPPRAGGPRPSSSCSLGRPSVHSSTGNGRGRSADTNNRTRQRPGDSSVSLQDSLASLGICFQVNTSWDDLRPALTQGLIDRVNANLPAAGRFGATTSRHMGANKKPLAATDTGGGRDTLGVIGRDVSVPRHDHYPRTGLWRWQELEMRLNATNSTDAP